MSYYFVKTPKIIRSFYKNYLWNVATKEKVIYLTFDDGPTPIITDFILETLKNFNAKATFFCIGKNMQKYPEIVVKMINERHLIGNHTYNHLNGWKTKNNTYLENVQRCQATIKDNNCDLAYFRPPYGKIKKSQATQLIQKGYKIVMWSLLSGDFDTQLSKESCLDNVIKQTQSGDIIVLHDSAKASEKVQYVLPLLLAYFSKLGFQFKTLP